MILNNNLEFKWKLKKIWGIFIKLLNKQITTEDRFRSFSNEYYKLNWIDKNRVKSDYYYGNDDVWKSETISFE